MTTTNEIDTGTIADCVIAAASRRFSVTEDDIKRVGRKRVTSRSSLPNSAAILYARTVACYALYTEFRHSYPEIARAIGWASHVGAIDHMTRAARGQYGANIEHNAAVIAEDARKEYACRLASESGR